jgi:tetratricopeptide (TPR) repeat protein
LHKAGLSAGEMQAWRDVYQEGIEHEAAGRYDAALQAYQAAAKIDPAFADLRFRRGRLSWRKGEFGRAQSEYLAARDYDALRFRPHTRINEIIRDVANSEAQRGVRLADCAVEFERHSPHGTPGEELFWEHVHLRFAGAYLAARSVLTAVEAALQLPSTAGPSAEASEAECARRLALTDWDRHRLTAFVLHAFLGRPPFTGQLDHEEQQRRLAEQLQQLAPATRPENFQPTLQAYGQALSLAPDDWRIRCLLAQFLVSAGQHREAERQYRAVLQTMPDFHAPAVYDGLCKALAGQGCRDEVIELRRRLVRRRPYLVLVHFQLAQDLRARGDFDEAIRHYRIVTELEPRLSAASENLATELSLRGDGDEALEVLQRAIEVNPDRPSLHRTAAQVLLRQHRKREAAGELRKALRIDPEYAPAREMLEAAAE